jgi:hypothetical protein
MDRSAGGVHRRIAEVGRSTRIFFLMPAHTQTRIFQGAFLACTTRLFLGAIAKSIVQQFVLFG